MNWFLLALKNTFHFRGRARRKEYGWFNLGLFLINLTCVLLVDVSMALGLTGVATVINVIIGIFGTLMFVTNLSVTARRLHDLGYSGWWQLSPALVGLIGLGILFVLLDSIETAYLYYIMWGGILLISIFYIGFYLVLLFKDGQRFGNKYGQDPKAPQHGPQAGEVVPVGSSEKAVIKQTI